MIIRFFRSSYHTQLFALVLVILLFWLPEIFVPAGSTAVWEVVSLPNLLWLQQLVAIILFFFTTLFVNHVGSKHRLSGRNSYFAAFFFILAGSAPGSLTQMSPYIFGIFFFALFYQKVFDFQASTKIITTAFDAGLSLGIVSLFYPPALFLLLFIWLALLTYQVDEWRPYFTGIVGMLLPWFFILSGFFWFDKLPEVLQYFLQAFHFREIWFPFTRNFDVILFTITALTTLTGVFSLLGKLSSFNISLRQHSVVSLWGLVFSSLIVFLFAAPVQALLLLALPASLILGAFFSRIKQLRWANLFVLFWILLIFLNHYLPLFHVA
ncbi:MAG: hypothetical protein IEMM0006_0695 [bacterium]|nr:MAG: hypothetical protein IEMM0006_0695 [bacterium]